MLRASFGLVLLASVPLASAQVRFDVSAGVGVAQPTQTYYDLSPNTEVSFGARLGGASLRLRALDLSYERPVLSRTLDGTTEKGPGEVLYAFALDASYAVPVYGPLEVSAGVGYRQQFGETYRLTTGGSASAYTLYVPLEVAVRVHDRASVYGRSDLNMVGLRRGDVVSDRTQVGIRVRLGR